MLAKKYKIATPLFRTIRQKGYSFSSPLFSGKGARSQTITPRFSVVISGKVCKSAVERNRKRRQIYEAIRKNRHLWEKNTNLILYGKKNIQTATYRMIEKEIENILK